MTDSPVITCVVPTYRRPKLLARAVRSVLNQSFTNLRVFVTDNSSGDETADVIRDIQAKDPRVVYHCHTENIGMHANFYYGMSRVETPFYSLLSDDDVLLPEFYETAYNEFIKHPQSICVATKVPCVTEDGRFINEPLSSWDRMGLFEPPTGAFRVAAIAHPTITGILFRREFLSTPHAYPDPNIFGADYEMIFNVSSRYAISAVDKEGALFVQHNGPRAEANEPSVIITNCLNWIDQVDNDDRFPEEIKRNNRRKWEIYLAGYLNGQVIRLILQGEGQRAEEILKFIETKLRQKTSKAYELKFLLTICNLFPLLKPLLIYLYKRIKQYRNQLRTSQFILGSPKYKEYLCNDD